MATILKEAPSKDIPTTRRPLSSSLVKSIASWALLIFAITNIMLWGFWGADKQASKDLWSGAGSIDLALNDFNQLPTRPNVVLLGSSLMMFPFWCMDEERDPKHTKDIFHHHRSHSLEDNLRKSGYTNPVVFNMAIFGQMASDAYLYVDEYLKNDKKPDYLVLGIAPRDFSDADVPSPMATISFKRLVNLSNFFDYAALYLPSLQNKAEFLVEHLCFFYGRRWKLQHELEKAVGNLYSALGWKQPGCASTDPTANAGFMLTGSAESRWSNSLLEYRRRYHNLGQNSSSIQIQMGFLKKIIDVCQKRGIKVIIVNMPLTDLNRNLFPPGFYSDFSKNIQALCSHPDVTFLDLGSNSYFNRDDFWDTTHLTQSGGHKLLNLLAPRLKS